MKNKIFILIALPLISLLSCEKSTTHEPDYDCFEKTTGYSSNNTETDWEKYYFKDGRIVEYSNSSGVIQTYKYDNEGNNIEYTSDDFKLLKEYNKNNQLTKQIEYNNNLIKKIYNHVYNDTLLIETYVLEGNNDTIGFYKYYYNEKNRKDSVISSDNKNTFYYYSENEDSVITFLNGVILEKEFLKYKNNNLIYQFKQLSDDAHDFQCRTWEYNEKNLLIKKTYEDSHMIWNEELFLYNTHNQIIRKEYIYDERYAVESHYSTFIYEDMKLTKISHYNFDDSLIGYFEYENTCK